MEMRLSGQDISLEPQEDSEEQQYAPIAYLTDDSLEPVEQMSQREQERLSSDGLGAALSQLDERSRRIISARWLQDEDHHGATLHDLANEFGVSAERIRQIEQRALAKLKTSLSTNL